MTRPPTNGTRRKGTVRCAVYTRKSSEEGLEQEFNSLLAQREACEAFITSQRHEGWVCLPKAYDDGGVLRRDDGSTGAAAAARRHHGRARRYCGRLQDRPADPLARRFCQDRRDPRHDGRLVCLGDEAVQHDDVNGALDPKCSVVLCAVRARGHRRAHPRQARRFNATLVGSDEVPFAALAEREGVSLSYFTRLVRLSYLAPDITHAILDGRQPHDLTAEKLLEHSRLPLAWHDQRTALGFA